VAIFAINVTIYHMKIITKTLENNANLKEVVAFQKSKIDTLSEEISSLKKQVEWFKIQFNLIKQSKFGKSSETSESMNLTMFDEAMPEKESKEDDSEIISYTRKKKSCGRKFDISDFPKEQKIYDLDESEKICACGSELKKVGEDSSLQIDHIPETFRVIEHVSLKYCCRQCETIKSAKKPETAIPKCMATSGFISEVITKKYEDHLPLYRQSKIFEKLGADIPANTLGNWVMRAAEVLKPLHQALVSQISNVKVLQADETRVKTLKPNKQGYLWGYHGCDDNNRFILFEYSPSRAAQVPNNRLSDFAGILQTDGYSGYNDLRAKDSVISIGCWDHARRKFADIIKIAGKNKTGKAHEIFNLINNLYKVEKPIKLASAKERKAYRQEHAKPILDLIYQEAININAPPKSLLGMAVTYLKNQWSYLINYLDYGEAPISNIWIENQIRPFALGRRNWLFTGNPESAKKVALLYSLIQTCKMNDINARSYLEYVLDKANTMRRGDVSPESLLPQFIEKSIFNK